MGNDTNTVKRLEDGNAYFRKTTDPALLAKLVQKQEPIVAILTCSDSRVVPERIFNLSMGDAFVVRVAGNSASEPSVLGSLEYAVEQLHVRVIVVLGHTGCGTVRAAMEWKGPENLSKVVRDIDRARNKVADGMSNDPDAVAESNVRLQLRLIMDNSLIVMDRVNKGQLSVVGAMYNMANGAVRFL